MLAFESQPQPKLKTLFLHYGLDFDRVTKNIAAALPNISVHSIPSGMSPTKLRHTLSASEGDIIFFAFDYTELLLEPERLIAIGETLRKRSSLLIGLGIIPPIGYASRKYATIKRRKSQLNRVLGTYIDFDLNKYRIFGGQSRDFIIQNAFFGVQKSVIAINNLIQSTGFVSVDFADVRTVLHGKSIIGTGFGFGENRVNMALFSAFQEIALQENPKYAKAILLNVIGGSDFALYEYHEIQKALQQIVPKDSIIIVGFTEDEKLTDKIQITAIFSGFQANPRRPGKHLLEAGSEYDDPEFRADIDKLIASNFPQHTSPST